MAGVNPQYLNQMTVNTGAQQPQGVFPRQFTRESGNLAQAIQTPTMPDIGAAFARQGVGIGSPAIQYGMGAAAGQQMAQAAAAPQQIGLQHGFTNLANMLAGYMQQDQYGQALAGAGQQQLGNYQQFQNARNFGLADLIGFTGRMA